MSRESPRVAIRADASVALGFGHIKRCISLGQALVACGAQVRFLTRKLGVSLDAYGQYPGIGFSHLAGFADDDFTWQADARACVESLADWRPDWVVVDHYGLDADWHRHLAGNLGARICAIDDLGDRDIEADVLLDQNPSADHAQKYRGRIAARTTLLGGPRFAMLAPGYATASHAPIDDVVASIGIFMGGTDARDLSSIALRACREHAGFRGVIEIATTQGNPHLAGLRKLVQSSGDTRLSIDLPDLAAFFGRHGLQIGAGGGATWERCAVGAPSIGLLAAENQRVVLPFLAEQGALEFFEPAGGDFARELGALVCATLADPVRRAGLAARALALVDGHGARRVAIRLLADTLTLRDAVITDAEAMLAWRNHAETRKFSTNSKEIGLQEHLRWFRGVLDDAARPTYIAKVGSADVGVVRFDVSQQVAQVSLYLDPLLHGIGLGTRMLACAEARVAGSMNIASFEARVLGENARSRSLFESAGYRFEGESARKAAIPLASGERENNVHR